MLIDVINDLAFNGSEALVAQAKSMAAPLAHLKRRTTAAGVPTIIAPADCIVSNTAVDNDYALRQIKIVLKGSVAVSTRLRFRTSRRSPVSRRAARAE